MSLRLYGAALITALLILPSLEAQDQPAPIQLGPVNFTGRIRDRIEDWNWFTPSTGNPKYTLDDAYIRLAISETHNRFDWMFEIETPILLNLPTSAVAPRNAGAARARRQLLRRQQQREECGDGVSETGLPSLS